MGAMRGVVAGVVAGMVAGMGCGCGLNGRLQKMDQLVCDSEGATVQVRQCHEKPSPSLQTPL